MRPYSACVDRENALLLVAARLVDDPGYTVDPVALDWGYILRAAEVQGVAPLLHRWLRTHADVPVARAMRDRLHVSYWTNHFRNRLLLDELARVVAAALADGIALMPLKGARLATGFYESAALRPLSDLDVVVHHGDLERFGAVLQSLGYVPFEPEPSYVSERHLNPACHEFCWMALRPGVDALIESRCQALELAAGRLGELDPVLMAMQHAYMDELWVRATGVSRPGVAGVCVPAEDLLLHVATHFAVKHIDFRLIWLHDVGLIVRATPNFDWDYLTGIACRLRVAGPLALALRTTASWLGAPIPDEPLRVLDESVGVNTWFGRQEARRLERGAGGILGRDLTRTGPSVWPLPSAMARVRGWKAHMRVVRWVAFPSRSYLAHRPESRGGFLGWCGAAVRACQRLWAAP